MKTDITSDAANTPADVLEMLAEALTHNDAAVREGAARELGKRKDKRGVNFLLEALCDGNSQVRLASATSLNEIGWRPADDILQARHFVALQEFQKAAALGSVSIDPLLVLIKDEDTGLRMAALETLSQIGGPRALKPLVEVLSDPNSHVRAVAVQALSRLGDPQSVDALAKLAKDPSWEVRAAVVDALPAINSPLTVPTLVTFSKDEAADVRLRAIELLGHMADNRGITALVTARVDENIAVRDAADVALQQLHQGWGITEEAKAAKPMLLAALKNEDDRIRTIAADVLRAIGQTPAMNSYLTAELGSAPQTAVSVLVNTLRSPNRNLRQAAAESLGRVGDQNAIPALIEALRDEDQFVREASLYSLNLLNWKPANDTEVVLRAVILQRWETAVLFDALALEPLVMALESDDPNVCRSAIDTLGQIGNRRACDPVAVMLGHPQKMVREAAAQALRLLNWDPSDPKQAVAMAIELGDWQTVVCRGAASVEPLISQIKENQGNREFVELACSALAGLQDVNAAKPLLTYVRDGQVAEAVVRGLTHLTQQSAGELAVEDLQAFAGLSNVFQFRYTFDARYGTFVRSGLQEVDSSALKKLARQELARRGIES